jgi:hypothetical protein
MVEPTSSRLPGFRRLHARREARRKDRRSLYFIEHYDSNGALVFSTHGLSVRKAIWVIGGFTAVPHEALDLVVRGIASDDHAGIGWLLAPRWGAPGALTLVFRGAFSEVSLPQAADRPRPRQVWADCVESPLPQQSHVLQHWPPNPDTPFTTEPLSPPMSATELDKLKQQLRKPARPIS